MSDLNAGTEPKMDRTDTPEKTVCRMDLVIRLRHVLDGPREDFIEMEPEDTLVGPSLVPTPWEM